MAVDLGMEGGLERLVLSVYVGGRDCQRMVWRLFPIGRPSVYGAAYFIGTVQIHVRGI